MKKQTTTAQPSAEKVLKQTKKVYRDFLNGRTIDSLSDEDFAEALHLFDLWQEAFTQYEALACCETSDSINALLSGTGIHLN